MLESAVVLAFVQAAVELDRWDDFLLLVTEHLSRMIGCDDVVWMGTDFAAGRFLVWRSADGRRDPAVEDAMPSLFQHPAIQSYLDSPTDLSPRRLVDIGAVRSDEAQSALRLSQRVIGRHQLSAITHIDPVNARGRGWVMVRETHDFTDEDLARAAALLPALLALERALWRRSPEGPDTPGRRLGDPRSRDAWASLSPRERDVVSLICDGLTAVSAARRLGISPRTVHKHLEHSYAKLGVHDRLLVAAARPRRPAEERTSARHPAPEQPKGS